MGVTRGDFSPSSPTETLSGLFQIKPEDISFSQTIEHAVFFRYVLLSSPVSSICVLPIFKFASILSVV